MDSNQLADSESRISIPMKDINAVFSLIDGLADREKKLLGEMLADSYNAWLSIASSNILSKLKGYTDEEGKTLKVVIEFEILPPRLIVVLREALTKGLVAKHKS